MCCWPEKWKLIPTACQFRIRNKFLCPLSQKLKYFQIVCFFKCYLIIKVKECWINSLLHIRKSWWWLLCQTLAFVYKTVSTYFSYGAESFIDSAHCIKSSYLYVSRSSFSWWDSDDYIILTWVANIESGRKWSEDDFERRTINGCG